MKEQDIVFILDRSGSMSGIESDTIGGFNSFINISEYENINPIRVRDKIIGRNILVKTFFFLNKYTFYMLW